MVKKDEVLTVEEVEELECVQFHMGGADKLVKSHENLREQNKVLEKCQHNFKHEGLVFTIDRTPIPGTSALYRIYQHKYYCIRCLKIHFTEETYRDNTFSEVKFGATPC
jgi:hypothetical protein